MRVFFSPFLKTSAWLTLWPRVARWYIFKPKISIWVKIGGPLNAKCCNVLLSFEIYYGHLVYFMAICNLGVIWYIFPRFYLLCQVKSGSPVVTLADVSNYKWSVTLFCCNYKNYFLSKLEFN
jgi:hypothetical protein